MWSLLKLILDWPVSTLNISIKYTEVFINRLWYIIPANFYYMIKNKKKCVCVFGEGDIDKQMTKM